MKKKEEVPYSQKNEKLTDIMLYGLLSLLGLSLLIMLGYITYYLFKN